LYCANGNLSEPSGKCQQGYYCTANATTATPTDGVTGNVCPIGSYCKQQSAVPTNCPGGYYCATTQLSSPTNVCAAGYYCVMGATTATPTDGVTGNVCPPGSYCPAQSISPIPCPPRTFSSAVGATNDTTCTPCTAGMYCPSVNLTAPAGFCAPGFYCPSMSLVPDPAEYSCPAGSYCSGGNSAPTPCPAGSYQDQSQQAACKSCPARYYCLNNTVTPQLCPAGGYCPVNSTSGTKFKCPAGTFSNVTGLANSSECAQCDPGKSCQGTGNLAPVQDCDAGYYCVLGASSPMPTDGVTGDICPAGAYCLQGSAAPTYCPAGFFTNQTGNAGMSLLPASMQRGY